MAIPNESHKLPGEIRNQITALKGVLSPRHRALIRQLAHELRAGSPDLYLVGAGDSLFASLCAQYYFARWANFIPHALDVMEFSRYFYRAVKATSTVFALSYSGETIRTLEASIAASFQGARLVAMTRDPDSSMARLADYVIPNESPLENSNARTGSFQSMHLSLLLLALEWKDIGSDVERVVTAVEDSVANLPDYINQSELEMAKLAAALAKTRRFYFLGAGIGWPIARYGYSKLYETASVGSIASELEQFAHGEIFSLDPPDCVVIIAQDGDSFARATEVADAIRKIGSTVWGLSDNETFASSCDYFTFWPGSEYEELSAISAVVPLQWFAYYWAVRAGSNPDRVRHKHVNSPLIRECPYWDLETYLQLRERPRGA